MWLRATLFTASLLLAVASATTATTCGDFTANATANQQICVSSCGSEGGNTRMAAACKSRCDELPIPSSSFLFGAVNYGMRRLNLPQVYRYADANVDGCSRDVLAEITTKIAAVVPQAVVDSISTERRQAQQEVKSQEQKIDTEISAYTTSTQALEDLPAVFVGHINTAITDHPSNIASEVDDLKTDYTGVSNRSAALPGEVDPLADELQRQLSDCTTTITTDVSVLCAVSAVTRQTIDASAERIWCVCRANPITSLNSEASGCD